MGLCLHFLICLLGMHWTNFACTIICIFKFCERYIQPIVNFFLRGTESASIMGGLCGVCTFFEFNMRTVNDKFFNKFSVCQ